MKRFVFQICVHVLECASVRARKSQRALVFEESERGDDKALIASVWTPSALSLQDCYGMQVCVLRNTQSYFQFLTGWSLSGIIPSALIEHSPQRSWP